MKTRAGIGNFLTAASVAAVLAMQAPNLHADDKQTTTPTTEESNRAFRDGYDLVIINGLLRLRDERHTVEPATVKAVVELLRKRYTDANIVYAPELENLPIPDVKLRARDLP